MFLHASDMLPGKGAHRVLWAASMAIAVLVAWAVITSPASGKEPSRVVFCGKSARSAVVDRAVLRLPVDDVPPTMVPPWSAAVAVVHGAFGRSR